MPISEMNSILYPSSGITRRRTHSKSLIAAALIASLITTHVFSAEPIEIGNRMELFVDNHLIDSNEGDVSQQLLQPEPKEVVFVIDKPGEGNTSGYYTLMLDSRCSWSRKTSVNCRAIRILANPAILISRWIAKQ